jgi:(2Fe-2S) ferredoxin
MPRPQKHVFICTQARPAGHPRGSCAQKGCGQVMEEFLNQLQQRNLFDRIMVTATGCIGPCGFGANVLVYPDGVMYGSVTVTDVAAIFDEHLLEGKAVSRLMLPADIW